MLIAQGQDAGAVTAAVIWDGIAGAVVAGIVSALVAIWVVRLTQKGARSEALAAESRAAAGQLSVALIEITHQCGLLAGELDRDVRLDSRRRIHTNGRQATNLHRPALQDARLRSDAETAWEVVVDFLGQGQRADDVQFGVRIGAGAAMSKPAADWHRRAHRLLGQHLAEFTKRLAQHRLGEDVDQAPIPKPIWPDRPSVDAD
jgi:hypothetical protein